MRIYVIGPVSGIADDNKPEFVKAQSELNRVGHTAFIPHDFIVPGSPWQTAMKRSLETLVRCDAVARLEGSDESYGARFEMLAAETLGMPCRTVGEWTSGFYYEKKEPVNECRRCHRSLPLSMFAKSEQRSSGRQDWCRDCMRDYKKNEARKNQGSSIKKAAN